MSEFKQQFPNTFLFDGEKASFNGILSSNYTWKAEVKIRPYNSMLTLYGIQKDPYKVVCQVGKKSIPILKSNLQKCIRRKDEERAVRTALAMYSYSPTEVLRRLLIIMIEDTLPFPDAFTVLAWQMCAVSKGYILSKNELEIMLGVVSTMCESTEYEVFNSRLYSKGSVNWEKFPFKDFLWAMEVRVVYGGMKCDAQMLNYHQELWLERLKTPEKWTKLSQTIYQVDIHSVDALIKDDILLQSIDYHCATFIPRKIREKHGNMTEDDIRMAIWHCSSSVNFRKPIKSDHLIQVSSVVKSNFVKISRDFVNLSQWYLGKLNLKE